MEQVNIALQIIPQSNNKDMYDIVDEAIELIRNSGIRFLVTPFETVMEGDYDRIMKLVKEIQIHCYKFGAESIIANLKIHSRKNSDVTIDDKMHKYK